MAAINVAAATSFFSLQALVDYLSSRGANEPFKDKGNAMEKLSEYVMTAEAAEILGVSQNTLRAWAADGRIPMRRNPANGYRLFKRSDLEDFLKNVAQPFPEQKLKKPK